MLGDVDVASQAAGIPRNESIVEVYKGLYQYSYVSAYRIESGAVELFLLHIER